MRKLNHVLVNLFHVTSKVSKAFSLEQTGARCTYRSFAGEVGAVTLLMTMLEKTVKVDDDEDGGRQHRPTWKEDDP
jgi:hypothetical protein